MKRFVIIVAGGQGSRMGTAIPKQFLLLNNQPLLMRTITLFTKKEIDVVLVLPAVHMDYWSELCDKFDYKEPLNIVEGGSTRFDSVKNGIDYLNSITNGEEVLVGIHDGVRPLVSGQVIESCYKAALNFGAAVPVLPVNESVRIVSKGDYTDKSSAFNRDRLKIVQTPQVFLLSILNKSYKKVNKNSFTDDASVVEAAGFSVNLVEGNRENIKITTELDLRIASLFYIEN